MTITEPMPSTVERLSHKLDQALTRLGDAKPFAKSTYQTDVFQIAETLFGTSEGMRALYDWAHRFDEVGVFHGGPWEDPSKLQPRLVAGGLTGSGLHPILEILSELRMLAAAKGRGGRATAADAAEFLNDVLALNLSFLFPADTESERSAVAPHRASVIRLFQLLSDELSLTSLLGDVVSEIGKVSAQRPIMTARVRRMIELATRVPDGDNAEITSKLQLYSDAVLTPTALSRKHPDPTDYRRKIPNCSRDILESESIEFARSMTKTGLTSPHHAVLLRCLRSRHPDLVPEALGLNELGQAEYSQNQQFALQILRVCIFPSTSQTIYGFANVLEDGLLSRQEVSAGLERFIDLDLQPHVKDVLLSQRSEPDGIAANSLLLAGVISAFGQPLGVGQGLNPTCQSARAISLWAQHAHGYLLELLVSAARDGVIEVPFEGQMIRSDQLTTGLATDMNFDLDSVSAVLVPHLDLVYAEMMNRVAFRHEDGHKWVNPAFYGRWVPNGFVTAFSRTAQHLISGYTDFVRRFFATHHPEYNDGHSMMYPNPAGILVTNSNGDYLGPHAISIQRIQLDPSGVLRVYFYNPNNEGRQNWGHGVQPTVDGNGELEGESSLTFHDFTARLYAFHYNPYEEGDAYAVPASDIKGIETAARNTWGKAFTWTS